MDSLSTARRWAFVPASAPECVGPSFSRWNAAWPVGSLIVFLLRPYYFRCSIPELS